MDRQIRYIEFEDCSFQRHTTTSIPMIVDSLAGEVHGIKYDKEKKYAEISINGEIVEFHDIKTRVLIIYE